jgi:hypothetical protein
MLMTDVLPRQDPSLCMTIPVGTTLGQMRDVLRSTLKNIRIKPTMTSGDLPATHYTKRGPAKNEPTGGMAARIMKPWRDL